MSTGEPARVLDLRCAGVPELLGTHRRTVELSWRLAGSRRGLRQGARRIRVAIDNVPADLAAGVQITDRGTDALHVALAPGAYAIRSRLPG